MANAKSQLNVDSTQISVTYSDKAQGERHRLIGNAQMSAERYEQAIDSYTKAISSDPCNAVHYSNRAAAYSMAGDHRNAIRDAEKAIETDPSFVKAYQRLGNAQHSTEDYLSAISSFERGLQLDPTNTSIQQGLLDAKIALASVRNNK